MTHLTQKDPHRMAKAGWQHSPEAIEKIRAAFKKLDDRPCNACGLSAPEVEFYYHSRGKKGGIARTSNCKNCRKLAAVTQRNALKATRLPAIMAYKARRGCIDCGERDPDLLIFHHIDPSTKAFNVADGRFCSVKTVELEIEKCWVMCQKCHSRLHYRRAA